MRQVGRTLKALTLLLIAASATASMALADEPRPAPLARYFPGKDLVAYVEFDGLDAHSEAWKKTAAWKILNETPTGAMLDKVVRQLLEGTITAIAEGDEEDGLPSDDLPSVDDLSALVRQLVRSGFAFGINRKVDDPSAKPSCIGLVLRGGAKGPILPMIDKLLALSPDDNPIEKRDGPGGRKIKVLKADDETSFAWWTEGDDLAISLIEAKYCDAMIAALDGRQPNAVEHPTRKELAATVDGFEPVGLAFFDARALPEMPDEAKMFGLDGIKQVDVRWGYRGEALESLTRVVAPAPRKGVLALFDQPTFDSKSMPPLPSGVGAFASTSIDLVKVFDQVTALVKQVEPENANLMMTVGLGAFQTMTGRRLREDILSKIGPRVLLADVPTRVLVSTNPFDSVVRGMARVPRLSLLVEIKDRARLLKDLETLAKWVNEQLPIPKDPKAGDKPAPKLVRPLKNTKDGYEIALSPTYWPLPAGYRPSIVVGEKYLSLGTTPDVARQALKTDGELDGPMTRALASLPSDLTLVSVTDARNTALPEILANIPSLIQWWAFTIQSSIAASPIQAVRTPEERVVPAPAEPNGPLPPENLVPSPIPAEATQAVYAPPAFNVPPAAAPTVVSPAPNQQPVPGQRGEDPGVPRVPTVGLPAPNQQPVPAPASAAPASVPQAVPAPASVAPGGLPQGALAPAAVVVAPAPSARPVKPDAEKPDEEPTKPETPAIQLRLRLDPDEIPTPEEIRALLFPATYSLSSDAQGFRFATREAFPTWNPTTLVPLAISAAVPVFQDWSESAAKERATANLDKIHKALEAYHEKKDHFPVPATLDKEGKPLLSWRVELLPFLGEQSLYNEFHRDEPWDSPNNKPLLERMPAVFGHPSTKAEPGLTFYRGVIGKGAFFDPEVKDGVKLDMINDGPSDTLAIVEAKESVPWTKPGTEIPFAGDPMLSMLGGHKPGGFTALFADGTVTFLRDSISPESVRAISTREGDERTAARKAIRAS